MVPWDSLVGHRVGRPAVCGALAAASASMGQLPWWHRWYVARWWYGGDGPHLALGTRLLGLHPRWTGQAGENGQSSWAPGRGQRIRPSVPPRGNLGGPAGALAPSGRHRKSGAPVSGIAIDWVTGRSP